MPVTHLSCLCLQRCLFFIIYFIHDKDGGGITSGLDKIMSVILFTHSFFSLSIVFSFFGHISPTLHFTRFGCNLFICWYLLTHPSFILTFVGLLLYFCFVFPYCLSQFSFFSLPNPPFSLLVLISIHPCLLASLWNWQT